LRGADRGPVGLRRVDAEPEALSSNPWRRASRLAISNIDEAGPRAFADDAQLFDGLQRLDKADISAGFNRR
jgi:hypothetical protein